MDRTQRLVELVGDLRPHLADDREASDVRELGTQRRLLGFHSLAVQHAPIVGEQHEREGDGERTGEDGHEIELGPT